jgi:hypothetical protein
VPDPNLDIDFSATPMNRDTDEESHKETADSSAEVSYSIV